MNKILANTDLGIDQVVIDRKKPEDMFKEREDFLKIINGEDAPNIYGENRRILYWVFRTWVLRIRITFSWQDYAGGDIRASKHRQQGR